LFCFIIGIKKKKKKKTEIGRAHGKTTDVKGVEKKTKSDRDWDRVI